MKFSQLNQGTIYESKDGREIRQLVWIHKGGVVEYRDYANGVPISRLREMKGQDFAAWAHRKQGTSTHSSMGSQKLLTTVAGPKG
jgi:hypothetical protein